MRIKAWTNHFTFIENWAINEKKAWNNPFTFFENWAINEKKSME